jgi:tetratricopeptide (TPR) repeat protein
MSIALRKIIMATIEPLLRDYSAALDDTTRALLQDGEYAARSIHRGDALQAWLKLGEASDALQRAASTAANAPSGPRYAAAWNQLVKPYPHLKDVDKGSRSRSIWLHKNWSEVGPWWQSLPFAQRSKLASPAAIKLRYEAAMRPPGDESEGEAPLSNFGKLKMQVVDLQEENDKLRRAADGGSLFTVEDKPPEIARALASNLSISKLEAVWKALGTELSAKKERAKLKKHAG